METTERKKNNAVYIQHYSILFVTTLYFCMLFALNINYYMLYIYNIMN